jgi:probable rRNA maturation factor
MTKSRRTRSVRVFNGHPRLRIPRETVARLVRTLDDAAQAHGWAPPDGELSVAFLTEAALARIHQDFMGDPTPTDVITFPGDAAQDTMGEICVSADRAATVAARRSADFARELTLYVVHGWLHLAGCDDRKPAARREMRAAERAALAAAKAAGTIPAFAMAAR